MKKTIKNMQHSHVLPLAEQVDYLPEQIVSKTIAQNKHHTMTLFAFGKGEEISTHESTGDAMVITLDGEGEVTIGDKKHTLTSGESIVMPANVPHAVYAKECFKMLLIVLFPEEN